MHTELQAHNSQTPILSTTPQSFDSYFVASRHLHTFPLEKVAIKTLRDSTHEKSNADFMTEIAINKLLPSTIHQYKQNHRAKSQCSTSSSNNKCNSSSKINIYDIIYRTALPTTGARPNCHGDL
jgi:hypothetical protein